MATVDIVIPTYRGIQPECQSNLHIMIRETQCYCGTHAPWECNKGKHSVRLIPHTRGSSVIHWARNQIIAMALYGQIVSPDGRPDAEYLFLMDDDMLTQPRYLSRLLSYKKDFVTGIATVRRDPPRPNIRFWSQKDGYYITPVEWDWDSVKLMPIDAVGAAFMLIKRRVFEKMGEAYLACQFERAEDRRKFPRCDEVDAYWDKKEKQRRKIFAEAIAPGGDWKKADGWWFNFPDNVTDTQVGELGEDIAFCWKAKQLGFDLFADPQVLPGHIGDYGYGIADYRQWVECGKELGEMPATLPVNEAKAAGAASN
jgi:hypothetical protein